MQVATEVAGSVWKILKAPGDTVQAGEEIAIIESMKMEIPVEAPVAGEVGAIAAQEGDAVAEGQVIMEINPAV